MNSVTFEQLQGLRHGRFDIIDAPCLLCGPERRSAVNRTRKTLRLWCGHPERITYHCARCGVRGWAKSDRSAGSVAAQPERAAEKIKSDIAARDAEHEIARRRKALGLWRRGKPVPKTPVESYLRWRNYHGLIHATVRFLPASHSYAPAMIAAFGMAHEIEPGVLAIHDQDVIGVHITALRSDGLGKAGTDRDKIMVGKSIGTPIVLAPPNDGMGLAIAEGIEDALSVYEATGLGAWAAGSASRMPQLADVVPDYIECVTIVADADEVGTTNAKKLADALAKRSCETRLIVPSNDRRAD